MMTTAEIDVIEESAEYAVRYIAAFIEAGWMRRAFDLGWSVRDLMGQRHLDPNALIWFLLMCDGELRALTEDAAFVVVPGRGKYIFRRGRVSLAPRER